RKPRMTRMAPIAIGHIRVIRVIRGCFGPSQVKNVAHCASARGFFYRIHVPAELPAIARRPLNIVGVGFEIDDDPSSGFEESEVDDSIEDTDKVILDQDREFTMAALRLTCSI